MSAELLLVLAGVGAGIASTLAGLASLVSYPALLAFGLPPVVANVTNTTSMVVVIPASAVGARRELKGLRRRIALLGLCCGIGGALGAGLLLSLPDGAFETSVPWLIAFGSTVLLCRDALRRVVARLASPSASTTRRWPWALAVLVVGIYAGYFGAAAGIIMLAVLSLRYVEPIAVTNAVKTVVTGAGNLVAATVYAVSSPVDWTAVAFLGAGLVLGSWAGPHLARHLPAEPLRYAIGVSGLALAGWLGST